MPKELENKIIIFCNDCLTKSIVSYHICGNKCIKCRSYNTSIASEYDPDKNDEYV